MRPFLVPNATCSLTGASMATVPDQFVWLGIAAASDQSACCAFYAGSSTADQHLWTMVATSGHLLAQPMIGPFSVSNACTQGVYCALTGTRASALVATASY